MIQTLMEHWEVTVQIVTYTALAVGLYWGIRFRINKVEGRVVKTSELFDLFRQEAAEHWKHQEEELDRVESKLDSHINSPAPHMNCPAHEALIRDMIARLDRVQEDIREVRSIMLREAVLAKKGRDAHA
jgi:hypothetical protein